MLMLYYDPVMGARYWLEPIKLNRSQKKSYDEKKFLDFVDNYNKSLYL